MQPHELAATYHCPRHLLTRVDREEIQQLSNNHSLLQYEAVTKS